TPSAISSVDGCVLGSVQLGRRLSTTTSWPPAAVAFPSSAPALTREPPTARAVAISETCRPRPPPTTGGYSHETIRTFTGRSPLGVGPRASRGRPQNPNNLRRGVRKHGSSRGRGGGLSSRQAPCVERAEQIVGAVPAVGQAARVLVAAGCKRARDLPCGV